MTLAEAHDVLREAGFHFAVIYSMGSYDVIVYTYAGKVECNVWRTHSASKEITDMCLGNTKRGVEVALDKAGMEKVLELCP
jgi:hypothetical protein